MATDSFPCFIGVPDGVSLTRQHVRTLSCQTLAPTSMKTPRRTGSTSDSCPGLTTARGGTPGWSLVHRKKSLRPRQGIVRS